MKKYLAISFLLSVSLVVKAQHCPFDFSAIIVLNIHAQNDTMVIPNLIVTMYDSNDNKLNRSTYKNGKWEKETDLFWQNPNKTTFTGYIDNNNPAVPEKIRFPFAKRNYVLVVAREMQASKYTIKIEDPSGKYDSKIIHPQNKDVYTLCGTYQLEEYVDSYQPNVVYEPIEVILK